MDRTVANMSTEQLYRKRTFDRLNQRAARARKKSRIAELEEEVADLKRRLTRSEGLVKQLQNNETCLREIINSARVSLQMVDHHTVSPFDRDASSPSTGAVPDPSSAEAGLDLSQTSRSPPTSIVANTTLNFASHSLSAGLSDGSATIDASAYGATSTEGVLLRDADTGLSLELPISADESLFNMWDGTSILEPDANNTYSLSLFGANAAQDGVGIPGDWPFAPELPLLDVASTSSQPPPWERLPLHASATCRLDSVLLEIIVTSRQHVQSSGQLPEKSFPSVRSLLNPATRNSQNPISDALGQHGKISMAVKGSAERVACLYYMSLLLRWLISPTKRNYEAMPDFLRPVEAQLTIPHPIWVDTIVWPEARKRILQYMDLSEGREFSKLREITGNSLSIHWPHDISSILIVASNSELQLNPDFESHVRQLKHWTVGLDMVETFPYLDCIPTTP